MMNKSMVVGIVVGAIAVTAGGALAGYKMWGPEYAEVTNVTPKMETIRTPREECRDVQVTEKAPVKDEKRIAGTAIGAVVGGIIGSQIGSGDGRKVATAAGAAGGGYAGSKIQKNVQNKNTVTSTQQECRTVYDSRQEQDGYEVTYVLDGQTRTVHMDSDPGRKILVKNGQPVFN